MIVYHGSNVIVSILILNILSVHWILEKGFM